MKKTKKLFFYISYSAILILLLSALLLLFGLGYESLCRHVLGSLGKLHKLDFFKEIYFPRSLFNTIKTTLLSIFLAFLFGFIFLRKFLFKTFESSINSLAFFLKRSKIFFVYTFSVYRYFVFYLLIVAAYVTYNILSLPARYDECFTVINFTRNGIATCITYYFTPNNHVFFSLLTGIINLVHIDLLIESRIVSLIAMLLTFIILFRFLTDLYGEKVALFSSCVYAFSYSVLLYSFQARGYTLESLFSLLIVYSIYKINTSLENDKRFYWITYTFSSILGFYTVPSFLYPFMSINIFAFLSFLWRKDQLLKLILSNIFVFIGAWIVYIPILLINGVGAITNNRFVWPLSFHEIMTQYYDNITADFTWLLGFRENVFGITILYILFITLIINLFVQKEKKYRTVNFFILISFIIPWIVPFLQKVFPYSRVYLYLNLGLIIIFSSLLYSIANYFSRDDQKDINSKGLLHLTSLLAILVLVFNFNFNLPRDEFWDSNVGKAYVNIDAKKINSIFSEKEDYETDLLIKVYRKDYGKHIIVSRDSLSMFDNDVIILGSGSKLGLEVQSNKKYKEILRDNLATVFIRKDFLFHAD